MLHPKTSCTTESRPWLRAARYWRHPKSRDIWQEIKKETLWQESSYFSILVCMYIIQFVYLILKQIIDCFNEVRIVHEVCFTGTKCINAQQIVSSTYFMLTNSCWNFNLSLKVMVFPKAVKVKPNTAYGTLPISFTSFLHLPTFWASLSWLHLASGLRNSYWLMDRVIITFKKGIIYAFCWMFLFLSCFPVTFWFCNSSWCVKLTLLSILISAICFTQPRSTVSC